MNRVLIVSAAALALAACNMRGGHGAASDVPGDSDSRQPFSGIGAGEVVRFTGTEPFWGGQVKGDAMTYSTLENPQGDTVAVKRFAGRNGLGVSGLLKGAAFDMTITPGACSDGMSDRSFPFTVTLLIGGETRNGCAWSDTHPYSGPKQP